MKKIRTLLINILPHVLPYAGFLLVLIVVFWVGITAPDGKYLFGWDTQDLQYYTRFFYRHSVGSGTIPWWDPYRFAGNPFAASGDGPILFYPGTLLFAILPVELALTWFYLLHTLLAMSGMYILLLRFTKKLPAWFGGIAFGLSGYFVPRVLAGTTGNMASAAYLPLTIATFLYAVSAITLRAGIRRAIVPGIIFALQLMSGDQRMALFTLMGLSLILAVYTIVRKKPVAVTIAFIGFLMGCGISAIQIIPQIQFMSLSHRSTTGSYEQIKTGVIMLNQLSQLFYPLTSTYKPNRDRYMPFIESPYYAGIVPLMMAGAMIIWSVLLFFRFLAVRKINFSNRMLPFCMFLSVAILGMWVSLGYQAPVDLHRLFYGMLPFYQYVRGPIRFLLLFVFGISGLSALMLSAVKNRSVSAVITMLLLFEAIPFTRQFLFVAENPHTAHDAELVSVLKNDANLYRLHENFFYVERLGYSLDINAPLYYQVFATNGYSPLILKNYQDFYESTLISHDISMYAGINQLPPVTTLQGTGLDFLNVKYVLGNGALTPPDTTGHYKTIISNPYRWFTLLENTRVLPRFFMIPKALHVSDREEEINILKSGGIDLSRVVLLTRKLPGDKNVYESSCLGGKPGAVTLHSYDINKIVLSTDVACDAYLVSSEVMYPGWTGYIDSVKTQVFEGNLAFRTVFIPKGKHIVEYRYEPWIFRIGAGVSFFTLIIWLIFFLKNRKSP